MIHALIYALPVDFLPHVAVVMLSMAGISAAMTLLSFFLFKSNTPVIVFVIIATASWMLAPHLADEATRRSLELQGVHLNVPGVATPEATTEAPATATTTVPAATE